MSQNPVIEFDVTTGSEYSTGVAGPLAIENSLNNLKNSFVTHKDPLDGDHDGRYYTEAEIDAKLQAITQGAVADGSVTIPMLAFDPATQTELDSVNKRNIGAVIYAYNNLGGAL